MTGLSSLENVVRVIFPSTMMREGELLPAAFKLREREGETETYISVFRQYADTFASDITIFDRERNLPCAILNVGEVHSASLSVEANEVKYCVQAFPTTTYKSHAGIVINIAGIPIEGSGIKAFTSLGIGEYTQFHMLAIRRHLVEIAKKRLSTVKGLLPQDATDIKTPDKD
ncbi:MAG: hypothetical protein IJ614_06635 [Prevotella sp.]|nr:hypothetical protein [Prevotella sp.]